MNEDAVTSAEPAGPSAPPEAGLAVPATTSWEMLSQSDTSLAQLAAVGEWSTVTALLAAAVETTSVGVVVTDPTQPDNPLVYCNPAYLAMTGYRAEEVLGRNPRFLQGAGTDPQMRHQLREAIGAGRPFTGIILNYRKDGSPIWNEVRITPIRDAQGQIRNWVGLKTDISTRVRLEEELRRQALHDALTGLPNRALLLDRAAQALQRAQEDRTQVALLLLDLNNFKEVNDTFGHQAGDTLLRRVADRICLRVRRTDTVARLGGDEFAVVLPGVDATTAPAIAATLQAALAEPLEIEGVVVHVQASIGIAVFPEHGVDEQALLQHADVAMYQGKDSRQPVMLYAAERDSHSLSRVAFNEDLRTAVAAGQFTLYYQPIIELRSGEVSGAEALIRWQHPALGLLGPDAFLPLLEQLGLLGQVTHWVLREAVQQQRRWQAAGRALRLHLNFSANDLHDEMLLEELARTMPGEGCWCIELTEGALSSDLTQLREVLVHIAQIGAQIAIDDYGTGYSSLSRLARLPVHELKIDRSFVQRMVDDPVDATIVNSTIGLAHSLGLSVVAEGVEDVDTLLNLIRIGCDAVQGYYLARPLPLERFEAWLQQWPLLRERLFSPEVHAFHRPAAPHYPVVDTA